MCNPSCLKCKSSKVSAARSRRQSGHYPIFLNMICAACGYWWIAVDDALGAQGFSDLCD